MSNPKVLVLRTAGTNCDEETAYAWQLAGAEPSRVHIRKLIERPDQLREYAILTIPGGFSYGDDISAGKILANQMVHHLSDAIREFVSAGRLVLGICNGFQVLVKAGLLPGSSAHGDQGTNTFDRQSVTLTQNDSARFEARWICLRSAARASAFVPANITLTMPIAHGEGKLVAADDAVLKQMADGGHIALTYCDAAGRPGPYPINPNGSQADIAGLTDVTGRILGLMPQPERHVHETQHPEWTQPEAGRPSLANGRIIFNSAVQYARQL